MGDTRPVLISSYTALLGSELKSPQMISGSATGSIIRIPRICSSSCSACTSFTSLNLGSQNRWQLHRKKGIGGSSTPHAPAAPLRALG